ncbi:hypothetical protein [Pseudonocardia acidicola]|uniref:Uncharacterized protein n=1 Tax=Pseudonocardia acidicola TaxID=2724939 RepID=A0ABX1SCJ8_9PSEU|nr:hypothetical protein [Pseudonocardia acidicola]NMH98597.1 hypothetical protein [Pseudonocardia acidicola]
MSRGSARPLPDDVFRSFVRELAARTDKLDMLGRLRRGHQPDRHGWCEHPEHAHRWERHPCPVLRLADLVEATDEPD